MHLLVGIASQGPGAADRLADALRQLASQAQVIARSRPWEAPSADGGPAGLVAAVHVETRLPSQEVRPWLWDLEGDGSEVQLELLAGRQRGTWRWGIELDHDGAWMGPLADIVPDLKLPTGLLVHDHLLLRPHPGAAPWMDAGHGRTMDRPALEDRHVGRTWETRRPGDRPVPRRKPTFQP